MAPAFDAPTVIRTKRDGGRLSDAAIDWIVGAYTDGRVAEEQMAALLMAILLRGMDRGETARWTAAMLASGETLDFSDLGVPTVDKPALSFFESLRARPRTLTESTRGSRGSGRHAAFANASPMASNQSRDQIDERCASTRGPAYFLFSLRFTPGSVASSSAGSSTFISSSEMRPMTGSASAPVEDWLKVTPYLPVT